MYVLMSDKKDPNKLYLSIFFSAIEIFELGMFKTQELYTEFLTKILKLNINIIRYTKC